MTSRLEADSSAPFVMPILKASGFIRGGLIVNGRILRGTIRKGEQVEILGNGRTFQSAVAKIEAEVVSDNVPTSRRVELPEAMAGTICNIYLPDVYPSDAQPEWS